MSYDVSVDLSQWDATNDALMEKFKDIGDILTQFADNRLIPQLQSEAGSQRQVHTGHYMGDWYAQQEGNGAVVMTDAFYWKYLEFGTYGHGRRTKRVRTRLGSTRLPEGQMESVSVAATKVFAQRGITPKPVVREVLENMGADLKEFINGALRLGGEVV